MEHNIHSIVTAAAPQMGGRGMSLSVRNGGRVSVVSQRPQVPMLSAELQVRDFVHPFAFAVAAGITDTGIRATVFPGLLITNWTFMYFPQDESGSPPFPILPPVTSSTTEHHVPTFNGGTDLQFVPQSMDVSDGDTICLCWETELDGSSPLDLVMVDRSVDVRVATPTSVASEAPVAVAIARVDVVNGKAVVSQYLHSDYFWALTSTDSFGTTIAPPP